MMGRPQGAPGSSSGIGVPGSVGGNVGPTRSDSIMIRNLPPDCNWQILREGFAHCGEIKYAEMKERGTGLIRFTGERDAERAVCKSIYPIPYFCLVFIFWFIYSTKIIYHINSI